MTCPHPHHALPLRLRLQLWALWQIETFLLAVLPKGHLKRLGLDWVDRRYEAIRSWAEGRRTRRP